MYVVPILLFIFAACAFAVDPLPRDSRFPAIIERTISDETDPMHMPTDVAVDSQGTIYVADGARDRIVTFAREGQKRFATSQPASQQLKRPIAVYTDDKDQLWITDTDNHRLVVLDREQKLIETIDLPKTEAGKDTVPTDVLVTARGLFVVDNLNHRLLARANGQWTSMGRAGSNMGLFQYPFMLALGKDDDLFITEAIGARMQILSKSNKWAGIIGTWGVELGQFYRPKGIAVDSQKRIFIGDSTTNVIQVFDSRGRILGALTEPDGRPVKFKHPMGMCFDKQDRLYVTELMGNRIAVVRVGGNP